jgi:hypothetical protein
MCIVEGAIHTVAKLPTVYALLMDVSRVEHWSTGLHPSYMEYRGVYGSIEGMGHKGGKGIQKMVAFSSSLLSSYGGM